MVRDVNTCREYHIHPFITIYIYPGLHYEFQLNYVLMAYSKTAGYLLLFTSNWNWNVSVFCNRDSVPLAQNWDITWRRWLWHYSVLTFGASWKFSNSHVMICFVICFCVYFVFPPQTWRILFIWSKATARNRNFLLLCQLFWVVKYEERNLGCRLIDGVPFVLLSSPYTA
jgi:hypothetical protein